MNHTFPVVIMPYIASYTIVIQPEKAVVLFKVSNSHLTSWFYTGQVAQHIQTQTGRVAEKGGCMSVGCEKEPMG